MSYDDEELKGDDLEDEEDLGEEDLDIEDDLLDDEDLDGFAGLDGSEDGAEFE